MVNDIRPAHRPKSTSNNLNTTIGYSNQSFSRLEKCFSKTIHTPATEVAHVITTQTVARHSVMFGAVVCSLLTTTIALMLANYSGFSISPAISINSLFVGGVIGLFFEIGMSKYIRLQPTS